MASGHILQPLALLANFPTHQSPGQGGPFGLPEASGPSSHNQGFWLNPFDYGVYGLNGLFGPFRTPMASTAHGPYTMVCGILRPFLAKRVQGEVHQPPRTGGSQTTSGPT
ncbi:hypothetical protein O181_125968 [Austropuccinia psidii MF-1]|uniref:Uncharacterized protein n=1 Tax=Austropuccinia psidii MF-1 TaxID=1389203 RepID=A0A9Q3KRM0_9BASI|nr:hypothetical protein [Austropuccinia psidii MF-1]